MKFSKELSNMFTNIAKVKAFHRLLSRHGFYPLVLSTCLAVVFLCGRIYYTGQFTYSFLFWNLFLAWCPYLFALLTVTIYHQIRGMHLTVLMPLLVLWLVFLPNAPYIVTDLVHLAPRDNMPIFYDIAMFAMLAWTGMWLAILSLSAIQDLMQQLFSRWVSYPISWLSILGCGLGIFVGRTLRFNSWDAFTKPLAILLDIVHTFARHPLYNVRPLAFTAMFTAFFWAMYATFRAARRTALPDTSAITRPRLRGAQRLLMLSVPLFRSKENTNTLLRK